MNANLSKNTNIGIGFDGQDRAIKRMIDENMGTHAGDGLNPFDMGDMIAKRFGVAYTVSEIIEIWHK